jgi:hypothetical protein
VQVDDDDDDTKNIEILSPVDSKGRASLLSNQSNSSLGISSPSSSKDGVQDSSSK